MPLGTVNADLIVGTNGGRISPENTFGMRNRIINGAMVIDQRNAGASVTPTANTYTLDRWFANATVASKFSVQQSTVAPAGFTNSTLITSTSAYSVANGDYNSFQQRIEAFNMLDMGWGTADAKTVTLSFWVRSSLTGTFGGSFYFPASTARTYPFSYSIPVANTWTQISIVIAGDTFTNTAPTGNNLYVIVQWGLGVGSTFSGTAGSWVNGNFASVTGATNLIATNGATFYITGVQLEVGTNATSFEYRPYGTELALCQRYTFVLRGTSATRFAISGVAAGFSMYPNIEYPVTMRATPTFSLSSPSDFQTEIWNAGFTQTTTSISLNQATVNSMILTVNVPSTLTTGGILSAVNSSAVMTISAEL